LLYQIPAQNLFSPFSNKEAWKGVFLDPYLFWSFFFEHHIHDKIFNIFSTNLHPISFQLNFNLVIVLFWMESNNVFLSFMSFCTSNTYKNELVYHISRTFEKKSCLLNKDFFFSFVFLMFLIFMQIRRIYYMLHIASYH
jgi:hypothetical protein